MMAIRVAMMLRNFSKFLVRRIALRGGKGVL
jgi:hypothetical protein